MAKIVTVVYYKWLFGKVRCSKQNKNKKQKNKKKQFVQFLCSRKAESIDPCEQQDSVVLSNGKQSKTVARSDKCLYEKDAICRMQEFTGYMKRLDENGVMIRKLACIQHTVCFVTCWEQTELK